MNLQKINYQKELEKLLTRLEKEEKVPTLLLHSCCAPCSSYVLEYLSQYFKITVFYYNPNIYPESEYTKRILEQQKLIEEMHFRYPVSFLAGKYDRDRFYEMAKGLEEVAGGFDYFTTTLSISPMKNAQKLNEIGQRVGEEYGVQYLLSDFKKKNGYKRSIELSGIYGLYRQDYCGCEFSYKARQAEKCV